MYPSRNVSQGSPAPNFLDVQKIDVQFIQLQLKVEGEVEVLLRNLGTYCTLYSDCTLFYVVLSVTSATDILALPSLCRLCFMCFAFASLRCCSAERRHVVAVGVET